MSISLRLDAPAVRSLIGNDDEFSLDLSRAVIAEIVSKLPKQMQDHIDKAIHNGITQQLSAMTSRENISGRGYNEQQSLVRNVQDKIKDVVDNYIGEKIREGTRAAEKATDSRIEAWMSSIDAMLELRIDRTMDAEINKRVAARLSEVLAAVSQKTPESVR